MLMSERQRRRFDFLCQEFNREANTLCSKSADIDLTRIGIALKAAIEGAIALILEEHQDWNLLVRPHHLPLA